MAQELKTYDFPVDHGDFTATVEQFYLKSEADKVLLHKDRKRCLAMAKLCRSIWSANIFIHEGKDSISAHYMRWEHRWISLAAEPTWQRFLQLIHKEA